MSESDATEGGGLIVIDKMSIDQAAGAFVMIAGAIGSLLLVIWQSKCFCSVNLCYIFRCERRPPNEEEMKSLSDQTKKIKGKIDKDLEKGKKEKPIQKKSPLTPETSQEAMSPKDSEAASISSPVVRAEAQPETEPEPEVSSSLP